MKLHVLNMRRSLLALLHVTLSLIQTGISFQKTYERTITPINHIQWNINANMNNTSYAYIQFGMDNFLAKSKFIVENLTFETTLSLDDIGYCMGDFTVTTRLTTKYETEMIPPYRFPLPPYFACLPITSQNGQRIQINDTNYILSESVNNVQQWNCSRTFNQSSSKYLCTRTIALLPLLNLYYNCKEIYNFTNLYLSALVISNRPNYSDVTNLPESCNPYNINGSLYAVNIRYVDVCEFSSSCPWYIQPTSQGLPGFVVRPSVLNVTRSVRLTKEKYLELNTKIGSNIARRLTSQWYPRSGYQCTLSLSSMTRLMYQDDALFVMLRTWNKTVLVAMLNKTEDMVWRQHEISIGAVPENFRLEFVAQAGNHRSRISLANLTLERCRVEEGTLAPACSGDDFQCDVTGVCLSPDSVCNLQDNCLYGEDEADCNIVPPHGQCTFEISTCGWHNVDSDKWDWTRHKGHTATSLTGPTVDHTMGVSSGHYMYVEASNADMGHIAIFESPVFPALQQGTSNNHRCRIRFFYHMLGINIGELVLLAVNFCNQSSKESTLWYAAGERGDHWYMASALIPSFNNPYVLQFVAMRGMRHQGDIAIDDISLAIDCFKGNTINSTIRFDGNFNNRDKSHQTSHHLCKDIEATTEIMPIPGVLHSRKASVPVSFFNPIIFSGIFVGVIALAIPCIILVLYMYKRHHRHKHVDHYNLPSPFELTMRHASEDASFMFPTSCQLQDHIISNNPLYAVMSDGTTWDHLKRLNRTDLELSRILGRGAFGEVFLGCLTEGDDTLYVAVKTLPELVTAQREIEFAMEATIMSYFRHPNIVKFFGVCFDQHPKMIVLELLEGGDLKTFLKESRKRDKYLPANVNVKDLLQLALDVALGCNYLEERRFIHRDIAARNCLLSSKTLPDRKVKIADFGLSKDIYKEDYYRKVGSTMLPIKWMPPEAFLDGTFTSKTDVWSYGVLLWEILSLGQIPYPGNSNSDIIERVPNGLRMDAPMNCAPTVYDIMLMCWRTQPDHRPRFCDIIDILESCLLDEEVLSCSLPVYLHDSDGSSLSDANDSQTLLLANINSNALKPAAYLEPIIKIQNSSLHPDRSPIISSTRAHYGAGRGHIALSFEDDSGETRRLTAPNKNSNSKTTQCYTAPDLPARSVNTNTNNPSLVSRWSQRGTARIIYGSLENIPLKYM